MIVLAQEGNLWRVTLNRPEKANALTAAMLQELVEIAEAAQAARWWARLWGWCLLVISVWLYLRRHFSIR
jgi:hypothetical protein